MPSDPSDPLQQRRDALTDWERGLRPKGDRHWVLWLALATVLVFLAWRGAEWLLTQQRAPRPTSPPAAVRLPIRPPAADVATSSTARAPSVLPPESDGVSKCISAVGKAEYSDGPCPTGSRATAVWVQPDVNLTEGLSQAQREASMRNNSAMAAQVQQHERRLAQNTNGDVLVDCAALDAHIKWIDAMARQPHSAWTQDELSRDRKESRDRQFRGGCR